MKHVETRGETWRYARMARRTPVPSHLASFLALHWRKAETVTVEMRRGRRGAWMDVDSHPIVDVEAEPPAGQARVMVTDLLANAQERVDAEDAEHDLRLSCSTTDPKGVVTVHTSDPVRIAPREDPTDEMTFADVDATRGDAMYAKGMWMLLKENLAMVKAVSGVLSSVTSAVGSLAMMHGAQRHSSVEEERARMEHEEEMRRWDSVDRASDTILGPLADKLGDFLEAKMKQGVSPRGPVITDPRKAAQDVIATLSSKPELTMRMAQAVGMEVAQDAMAAVRGAATAADDAASWAAWEQAISLLRPHAAKLSALPFSVRATLQGVLQHLENR